MQPAFQLGIAQERCPGEPGEGGQVTVLRQHEVQIRLGGKRGGGDRRVVIEGRNELLRRHEEQVRDRVVRQPQAGRAQQNQGADAVGGGDGEFGGDPATERRPDDVRAIQAEPADHIEVVIDKVVHRLYLGELIGPTETGVVGRDHVESARQELVELQPRPRPAGGVEEKQWLALAAAEQMDPAASELEVLLVRGVRQTCRLLSAPSRSPHRRR